MHSTLLVCTQMAVLEIPKAVKHRFPISCSASTMCKYIDLHYQLACPMLTKIYLCDCRTKHSVANCGVQYQSAFECMKSSLTSQDGTNECKTALEDFTNCR